MGYRRGLAVARPSGIRAIARMHEISRSCKRNLCIAWRSIPVTQAAICSLYVKAFESIPGHRAKLAGAVQKRLKTRGYQLPPFNYAHPCTRLLQCRVQPLCDS